MERSHRWSNCLRPRCLGCSCIAAGNWVDGVMIPFVARKLLMDWNWVIIATALSYVIGIVALFVVPANRKPGEATAWLLLIFLAPFLGAILFLVFGSPKLSRRRRAQQRAMNDWIKYLVADADRMPELRAILDPPLSPRYEPFARLNANLSDMPALAGNTVELLTSYAGAVDRIVADIDGAQRYVHVE